MTSPHSMAWAALALLLLAAVIGSPLAGTVVAILASCCAVFAIIYGAWRVRVAALLILGASLGLSFTLLPAAKVDMDNYRTHARSTASETKGEP